MKRKIQLAVVSVAIIIVSIFLSFESQQVPYEYEKEYAYEDMVPLYELTDDNPIQEKVYVGIGSFDGIGFNFGTYGHTLSGEIIVEITDVDTGKVVATGRKSIAKIKDNKVQEIVFDTKLTTQEVKEYQMKIYGKGLKEGESLTVFAYNSEGDSNLYMGGEKLDDKILVMSWYKSIFNWKRLGYLIVSLFVLEAYVVYVIKIVSEGK